MASNNHTPIGTIAKTHGVKGELIIRTSDPSYDLKEDWESIFLQIEGILVPFFISSLRPFKQGEWVVKFDWYDDKSQAEKLVAHPVWIEKPEYSGTQEDFYLDELKGYRFRDLGSGREGVITGYLDVPENPLLEAEADGESILIPAREEFIIEFDSEEKIVIFKLPEGLL